MKILLLEGDFCGVQVDVGKFVLKVNVKIFVLFSGWNMSNHTIG
jgi:hypothetical protein